MNRVEDNYEEYFIDGGYTSFSSLARRVNETSYPGRSGRVKRAPTLSEYEEDDTYYYGDDSHFEDRR